MSSTGLFRIALVTGTVIIVSVGISLVATNWHAAPSLAAARNAALRGDFRTAESIAARIAFDGTSQAREAVGLAATAAERQRRFEAAVSYLELIPDTDGAAEEARMRAGNIDIGQLRQPRRAEAQFQRALRINPDNIKAQEYLAFLLGISACSWEAVPHRLQLLKSERYDAIHLFLLCMGDMALENADELTSLQQSSPDDPRVLLGAARIAADRQDYVAAKAMIRRAAEMAPELVEIHVKDGQFIQEDASPTEIARWNADLPENANQHPGIWAVRATWAMGHGQADAAIRCFWECVLRDPNHERSNYQLSQLLLARGDSDRAQPFLARSKQLNEYTNAVKIAYTGIDDTIALRAATVAEELSLTWESVAWYRLLRKKRVFIKECEAGLNRLVPQLAHMPLVRTKPDANPTSKVDLSNFPLPRWTDSIDAPSIPPKSQALHPAGVIAFTDDAQELDLCFQYRNGVPAGTTSHRMFEFSGGGMAAFDYDLDGYPDLYMTQGGTWPPTGDATATLDQLFRNRQGIRFENVTTHSMIRENGFSEGVTSGDFDGDGFPDLYVANIGPNRFLHNNGDGTFSDVTDATGTAGEDRWSTSAAMADLNGDGLADLYVVNYLSGADIFERRCPDPDGKPRSCSPRHFAAAQDQAWLNLGDGTFRDITEESGILVPDGKGLGIVVGDLDHSGRQSVFIANDAVPNFFFVNQASAGTSPRFVEQAMISGLAVDKDGRPQACMGVAAGDANGDGLLDLFVTNFFNECNTYYRQVTAGTFEDATRAAHLCDVSLKMVGFGTQFLDIDLDGNLDLVIANGDVDDLRDQGRDFAQRPQCIWNAGDGTFREIREATLGSYFQQKSLGRGLARLDWNRDGREDFAVSQLDKPVALLTNRSDTGNFVMLRLVGTVSARDPIGASVTGEVRSKSILRQLTAGDGYMASNERLLTIGLGNQDRITNLKVRWPSGAVTEFPSLSANAEYVLIEGSSRVIDVHRQAESAATH